MLALLWVILAALPVLAQPGLAQPGLAQPGCPSTPTWTVCDLIFDLTAQENPDKAELRAEFRSPRHRTYLLRAFREGERRLVAQRAQEHFTHLRVTIEPGADLVEAAERIRAINARGLTADIVLASIPPEARERERYISDVVARFAAFN